MSSRLSLADRREALLETRWGSVLLSWDFLVAAPGGVLAALAPTVSDAVSKAAPGVLTAAAGIAAGILALALAGASFLGFILDREYLQLLRRSVGGVDGLRRPFFVVAAVSAGATATALVAALVWPALVGAPAWLRMPTFAIAAALLFWTIGGAVQLVELSLFHMGKREEFARLVEERRQHRRTAS